MIITIVAFQDDKPNSIAYRKFNSITQALTFYSKMLQRKDVSVISTRKVKTNDTETRQPMGQTQGKIIT